ncbi:MAG TPA: hypothetical protein VGD98_23590 [Ktedonobacteraceae bacterium]
MKLSRLIPFSGVIVLLALLLFQAVPGASLAHASGGGGGSQFTPFVTSLLNLDPVHETVTLPLHSGVSNGQSVSYILTDTSDRKEAQALGINWAPRLAIALGSAAVENATGTLSGGVTFPVNGTVDFSPTRIVVPGAAPNFFPPTQMQPGAVGNSDYSPLFTLGDGIVRDGSQVANSTGMSDDVASIDTVHQTVTLHTFFGFWNGHRTIYLHSDGSNTLVSSVEGSNFAPNLDAAPNLGSDDPNTSARDAIIPIVNGVVPAGDPNRQGLDSALDGQGDPDNINQHVPGKEGTLYTPVWDVTPIVWTQAAIDAGQRTVLTSAHQVANLFSSGEIVGGGNGPANASLGGVPAGGFISNCPLIAID